MLNELQGMIARLSNETADSVVGVGQKWGIGSGVVIAKDRVLTNAHNLRGDGVSVTFHDGRVAEANVVGADVDSDLAVLEVSTGESQPMDWSAEVPSIGGSVFAISNPGGRGLRVTWGTISGTERAFRGPRGRKIAGSVEHTAPLLPGSSGGPIVDSEGKVLGLNTHRLGEGFYLAIAASDELRRKIDSLSKGETPSRPQLGVGIAPAEVAKGLRRAVGLPEAEGLLVRFVKEGGPADKAGIKEGDLLVSAGEKDLESVDDLHEAIAKGGKLEIKILRGAEERTAEVTPE